MRVCRGVCVQGQQRLPCSKLPQRVDCFVGDVWTGQSDDRAAWSERSSHVGFKGARGDDDPLAPLRSSGDVNAPTRRGSADANRR
jgi:hypothetical protein